MDASLAFIVELALHTGDHLLSYFKPNGTEASLKDDRSLVTEADLAADRLISAAIQDRFPEDAVLSEELSPELAGEPRQVWVVDPLDGTTNFSLGLPIWGVSIARVVDGWPEMAAIVFPVLGDLYAAQRDRGATLNGDRLQTRPPVPGLPNAFFSCCTRTHRRYEVNIRYKTRILGSACFSFCAVARGMALIGFEATPKIWDIAASWLIVHEAGGMIRTLDSSQPFPLRSGLDYRKVNLPTLAAANQELLAYAGQEIRPKN
jgi:myo-inositol-1(or 4)-monophosphatase